MAPLAGVFLDNMRSALIVVQLPYTMSWTMVAHRMHQAFAAAERIRSLIPGPIESKEDEQARFSIADRVAADRMEEETTSRASSLAWEVVRQLYSNLASHEFSTASRELLLQSTVMIWSSFEALASDIARELLNRNPAFAVALLSDERCKRHFPNKTLSVEAIAARSFNVSASMGDLLLGERHLDSLPMLRDVIETLLKPDAALRSSLCSSDVWKLWHRRHIIVHRRGAVDETYLEKTGDDLKKGERLRVSAPDFMKSASMLRDLGIGILKAATALVPPPRVQQGTQRGTPRNSA
jgi:hypothetical protein